GPPASRVMRRPLSLQGPAHRCLCRNNLAENTRFVAKTHRGTSRKRQVPESPSVMVLYTCKWWSLLRILRKVFPADSICFRTDPQSSRVGDWGQVRESRAGWGAPRPGMLNQSVVARCRRPSDDPGGRCAFAPSVVAVPAAALSPGGNWPN